MIQIRDSINNGVLITHILNVKVSVEPLDRNFSNQLRRKLKEHIWNVPLNHVVNFNGQNFSVIVTWVMPGAVSQTAYYYTASAYNDIAVALHTRIALSTICNSIRVQNPQFGNDWAIAYLISKPLEFLNQRSLLLQANNPENNGNENDDEDFNSEVEEE
jgi:hypothetical protein